MSAYNRRVFLSEVGQSVFAATLGYTAAVELGLTTAVADDSAPLRLSFGPREPLIQLLQETPPDRLLPLLVEKLRAGVELRELVAAGALANARSFGGEDYVGFHTFMALAPAWQMAAELPANEAALPVLKVLYRNTARIHERGDAGLEVLGPLLAADKPEEVSAERLREAVRQHDLPRAERLLAAAAQRSPEEAYNAILPAVADGVEVHRTVLAYRAWDLLDLVGREHACTMLRQSLHYAVHNCNASYDEQYAEVRSLLPKVLDTYKLERIEAGTRAADDDWLASMCQLFLTATPEQAADAVAAALAEGLSGDSVAEAIALAANQLVLRDPGRTESNARPNKPVGSVHGDSIGVHASDAANAWRNIAAVSNRHNRAASLVLSGWAVARDRGLSWGQKLYDEPQPDAAHLKQIDTRDAAMLLTALDDAIRQQDQARACALVHVYGHAAHDPQPLRALLLRYAVSQDGALHAEKYFRTATQEFDRTRPRFRWRQMVALARVTASEAGQPAPGMDEARRLLAV
ncbi:MAG: hypothetical protein K1X74_20125 [Pirellulales bacterium]|nr:hypothetical protein [Pirellulales bacterium]